MSDLCLHLKDGAEQVSPVPTWDQDSPSSTEELRAAGEATRSAEGMQGIKEAIRMVMAGVTGEKLALDR